MRIRSYPIDMIKGIVRSPVQMDKDGVESKDCVSGSYKEADLEGKSVAFSAFNWWSDNLQFRNVFCEEHVEWELVPSGNYSGQLDIWYEAGLHPRFSTLNLLRSAKQQLGEARWAVFGRAGRERDKEARKKHLRSILEPSHTPEEFLVNIDPFLFTNLYVNDRRHRVRKWWKKKFVEKVFTTEDFFTIENQEFRRFMLRRGVEIKDVLGQMKLIVKDEEGAIYEITADPDWRSRRYLHVVCPSTAQDYLLEVPQRDDRGDLITTPKAARRWTFDVPTDAEFAKEA